MRRQSTRGHWKKKNATMEKKDNNHRCIFIRVVALLFEHRSTRCEILYRSIKTHGSEGKKLTLLFFEEPWARSQQEQLFFSLDE